MQPHATTNPLFLPFSIVGLIVALCFLLAPVAFANQATTTDDDDAPSFLERVFNNQDEDEDDGPEDDGIATSTTPNNPRPITQSTTTQSASTSTATSTSPARQQDRDVQQPDPVLEDVLNEILVPSTPRPQRPATTTRPQAPTRSAATTTATTTAGTIDITESTFSAQTANANSFVPDDYYIPLDKLSPQSTYALSTMAIILGIAGALLLLRGQQNVPVAAWSQRMNESLLES